MRLGRPPLVAVAATTTALALAGCTFELRNPGVTAACGTIEYEINRGRAGYVQVEAVHEALIRYGQVTDREVVFVGETEESAAHGGRGGDGPILVEFFWPDDAPLRLGFAEPAIVGERFVGGFIYVHPMLAQAAPDLVTRLVMHELGHLGGLADVDDPDELMNPELVVDDWGDGDRWGLRLTHHRCGDDIPDDG